MRCLLYFLLSFFLLSCFNIKAQDKDSPLLGEGIYAFLRRHNYSSEYYDEFISLNRNKFGKGYSLLLDVLYRLPSTKVKTIPPTEEPLPIKEPLKVKDSKFQPCLQKNPLFGKNYEEYEVEDQVLAGACFFLVSGHGGPDPGAICKLNGKELHEDEYAYDIMLRLARNLLIHGATVYVIIQDANDGIRDDEYLNNSDKETCMGELIPIKQLSRLKQRTTKINSLSHSVKEKYQRAVFIHVDSRSLSKQTDIFFYHTQNNKESKKMAETIWSTFQAQYAKHQEGRGFKGTISYRELYVLQHTDPTSVYIEVGNIKNSFDQKRFMLSNNRQALANWFLKAFIEDYNQTKYK